MGRDPINKSVGRVLEIFEYFRKKTVPLSVRQISEQLNYPRSSTAELMTCLDELGYVSYERKLRAYLPTMRLEQLGDWVYEALARRHGLIELVTHLADVTKETAILSAENDIYAQHIYVAPRRQHIKLHVPAGTRRLLCQSAHGWALLSTYPDQMVREIVRRTRAALGPGAQSISLDWLMVRLREARAKGYVFRRGIIVADSGIIAMTLPPTPDGLRLAIGVGGALKRVDKNVDFIVQTMRNALLAYKEAQSRTQRPARRSRKGS